MHHSIVDSVIGRLKRIQGLLLISLVSLIQLPDNAMGRISDDCDWTGSGLGVEEGSREVFPVHLRCHQGQVDWSYPRGALRVILNPGAGGEFRGCIRVLNGSRGAMIHLEGHRTLHLLHSAYGESPVLGKELCFESWRGSAALVVEADAVMMRHEYHFQPRITFQYDLEPLVSPHHLNDECRPCDPEQLLHHFCASEFLYRGVVRGMETNEEEEKTGLLIAVTKVLREASHDETNEVPSNERRVYLPLKCGVKPSGSQEHLFMGRRKLGLSTLRCAPTMDEWARALKTSPLPCS